VRHVRILGVSLIAMLALGALVASTASASLPEWGGCERAARGKYADSACIDKATYRKTEGRYEWFTGTEFGLVHNLEKGRNFGYGIEGYNLEVTIGPASFETTTGHDIACSGGYGYVQLGNKPSEIKDSLLTLEGCKEAGGEELECASNLYPNGPESITNQEEWESERGFGGKLGFVEGKGGPNPTVGIALTSFDKFVPEVEPKQREELLQVICEGSLGTISIGGDKQGGNAVISLISPVDTMTTHYTQTFSASEPGVQQWTSFEGKHPSVLDEFALHNWEQSAWTMELEETAESGAPPIEIKAIP
jgi:hypothetical protein